MTFDHPDYTIIRELGRGASGVVYLAVQNQLNRRVAVKVFSDPFSTHAASQGSDRRFLREARILAQLDHPHIVPVYELSPLPQQQGYLLAMAFVDGGTLQQRAAGLTLRQCVQVVVQIAEALDYAHRSGFVHRDVKPDNILFQNDLAMLADFGIARAAQSETRMTQHGAMLGTPEYMSPEQVNGDPVDGRSDLYSLGIVFYELLTGRPPFQSDSAIATGIQHLTTTPAELPNVFAAFQPLMHKLLAKDKEQRPADALELVGELNHATGTVLWPLDDAVSDLRLQAVAAQPRTAVVASTKSAIPTVARAIAVVVVLSAIAAWLFLMKSDNNLSSLTELTDKARIDSSAPGNENTGSGDSVAATEVDAATDKATDIASPVDSETVKPVDTTKSSDFVPGEKPTEDTVQASVVNADDGTEVDADSTIVTDLGNDADSDALAVTEKLSQAGVLWRQGQWLDGEVNAVAIYKELQLLAPERAEVAEALEDIFSRSYAKAEQAIANGELEDAAASVRKLQAYWPGDRRLAVLDRSIQSAVESERIAAQQRRRVREKTKRIAALFGKALAAEQTGKLLQPNGDNAFFFYQQVLSEDPQNNRAASALIDLKYNALQRVKQQAIRSQFEEALAALALLDSRFPGDVSVATELDNIRQQSRDSELQAIEAQRLADEKKAINEQINLLEASVEQWLQAPATTALSGYSSLDNRIRQLQLKSPQNSVLANLRDKVTRHQQTLSVSQSSKSSDPLEDPFNMPGF